ncbi:MAG: RloB domain-containing protein [Candidatus Latescibacteria bacterium]|nr:RloB domain-containing protein [Candidatus Latescibacterota bacterium]
MSKKRNFRRPLGERRYRKLFIVATEGDKTEPQYFAILNNQNSVIHVDCLKSKHRSSPPQVLNHMRDRLNQKILKNSDEAWLVVDKDQWTDEQLAQLHTWSQDADNYDFALSNPKFEYWLLLHFEDGTNIGSSSECSDRLKKHLPDYDKGLDIRKFTPDMVEAAICRAKVRDNPPCVDWPRTFGSTTVYKLVENILSERP